MFRTGSTILSLALTVFGLSTSAHYQHTLPLDQIEPNRKPTKVDGAERGDAAVPEANMERALLLIAQAGTEAEHFEAKDESARILAKAGDMLWEYERDTAKKYFTKAFETAIEFDRSHPSRTLRREIIGIIAGRENQLAEKLLKQTLEGVGSSRDKPSTDRPAESIQPESSALYLAAARALLESDLKRAVELASLSLRTGVTQELPEFLYELAKKSEAASDDLYRQALTTSWTVPFGVPSLQATAYLAPYPFAENSWSYRDGAVSMSISFASGENKGYQPNLPLQQEFLNFAFAQIMAELPSASPTNELEARQRDQVYGALVSLAHFLLPKFQRSQPDRVPGIEDRTRWLTTQLSESRRKSLVSYVSGAAEPADASLQSDDQAQRLLDQADAAVSSDERTQIYVLATMAALRRKDFDRAREIAQKITDSGARDQLLVFINFDAAREVLKKGELDDARRLAAQIHSIDQRAFVMAEIAEASMKKEDRSRTVELLDETEKMALKSEDSMAQAFALVRVVTIYAQIDPVRAFEVLAETIKVLNRLSDFDFQRPLVREIHIKGSRQFFGASPQTLSFDAALERLGLEDFDRALLLVQALEQKNLRARAILAVSRSALNAGKRRSS